MLFLTPGEWNIFVQIFWKKMLPFPSGENIFGQFPAAALSVSWYLIRMKILGSEYGALGLVEHCALQAKHKDLQSLHIRVNFTNIQIRNVQLCQACSEMYYTIFSGFGNSVIKRTEAERLLESWIIHGHLDPCFVWRRLHVFYVLRTVSVDSCTWLQLENCGRRQLHVVCMSGARRAWGGGKAAYVGGCER